MVTTGLGRAAAEFDAVCDHVMTRGGSPYPTVHFTLLSPISIGIFEEKNYILLDPL